MDRNTKKLLFDALTACQAIESFVDGRAFEEYERDLMLRSAVERQFEIVGEALNQAAKLEENVDDAVPDLRKIVGLRNRLIHAYATVNNKAIWTIVHNNLPTLTMQLADALK